MKKSSLVVLLLACNAVIAADLPAVVDHSSYPPSATPVNPVSGPSTNTLYELMGRLEQLQAEVQQLTGKVDEQAFRIDELKKHQSTMYSDFDERLQAIENKANGSAAPAADAVPAAPATADAVVADTKEAAGAAKTSEPAVANEPVPEKKPVPPAPAESQTAAPSADPAQATGGPEKQEYYVAYNELRNGHTKPSITLFQTYLSKYPKSPLANNAQYWLGEAYRVDQDNAAAIKAFNDVVVKYPGGAKVPDALLRLGMMELDQKNTAKAREYFTRVTTDYPKSSVAPLAAKKLQKIDEVKN